MTQSHNAYSRMFRAYPDALSLKDLSQMFGVSTKQASKLIHDGKIAAVKVGREYRIAKINAIKFLMGKEQKTCVVNVTSNPHRWTSPQLCDIVVSTKELETEVS